RNIIGRSPVMVKLLETVAQVSSSEATVLITGDSGTGKEMIAGAIHYNSPRKDAPFIKINCAAITETLLESELFGHEKGSFTGAQRRKEGKFRLAHGGSIFLDEIGEMPMSMQVKLLRVLQEREITRVGGEEVLKVDVRIIAASNRNLLKDIEDNRFREDLYYRLNVVELRMPPLRERKEDIPLLAQHYLELFSEKNHKQAKGFTPKAMDTLLKYEWPGNIRELMNVIERCVVLSTADYIDQNDLPFGTEEDDEDQPLFSPSMITGDVPLEEVEKATILNTLETTSGNKSEAARRLGITRKTLHKKLKKYGVMD
ncbi:MAG: sigma-54-dependent Fis family transcriptional regulator, partial [Desulfatiglans sp.]|nr:sigma-54-dependent Fis family transcriptional regulator [Desulfatiglans sp.]